MLFKTIAALVFVASANAHTIFNPALGVSGTPVRKDVTRPSNAKPCAKADVSAIDSTTPITAAADGTFTVTAQNFNAGRDGALAVASAKVDTAGTGENFAGTATIVTNGDPKPKALGTADITLKMPAGTTCTGGATGDLCLVSLTTAAKFGNCVVVQQGGAATGAASANGTAAATGNDAAGAASANGTAAATGNNANGAQAGGVGSAAAQAGAKAKAAKAQGNNENNRRTEPLRRALLRMFKEMA